MVLLFVVMLLPLRMVIRDLFSLLCRKNIYFDEKSVMKGKKQTCLVHRFRFSSINHI